LVVDILGSFMNDLAAVAHPQMLVRKGIMGWKETQIKDWSHLVEILSLLDCDRPSEVSRLFRGQSDSTWQLVDSLSRLVTLDASSDQTVDVERTAFDKFFSQAHLFLDPSTLPEPRSLLAWWAIMQHYGCPTRLLDWTVSPYVATYFAVVENWDYDGAVWSFDPCAVMDASVSPAFDEIRKTITSKDTRNLFWGEQKSEYVFPFNSRKHHIRSATQQGGFTLCGTIPRDHGFLIDQSLGNPGHGYSDKIVIKREHKPGFLRNLMRMNITANALFPGLDGLGKSISELVRLEARHEKRCLPGSWWEDQSD